jgi:ribonuclease VapC
VRDIVFVDASAIVAILTEEADGPQLAELIQAAAKPITSPIAVWEAAASISRKTGRSAETELGLVSVFLGEAHVSIVVVDAALAAAAAAVFDRYGRRSGHRAKLNMGDCFAYAAAQRYDLPLLCKGDDIALTDVRRVQPN